MSQHQVQSSAVRLCCASFALFRKSVTIYHIDVVVLIKKARRLEVKSGQVRNLLAAKAMRRGELGAACEWILWPFIVFRYCKWATDD
jgi:hypothetical protein